MWVAVHHIFRHAHQFHDLFDSLDSLFHGSDPEGLKRGHDQFENGHTRIQGCVRILEDQLHLAPHLAHLLLVQFGDILTTVQHISSCRSDQLEDTAAQCGLAAPGLTYNADGLAFIDGQIYRIHCMDNL